MSFFLLRKLNIRCSTSNQPWKRKEFVRRDDAGKTNSCSPRETSKGELYVYVVHRQTFFQKNLVIQHFV